MSFTAIQHACLRCGVCCSKGGPALHLEDLEFVRAGSIDLGDLVTLRRGELAWDQPAQALRPLAEELVKLRGVTAEDWRCLYYDSEARCCAIYDARPAECRALACWDTSGLEAMYAQNRARRCDVLGPAASLWPLIEEHERRCGYEELAELARAFLAGSAAAGEAILERVRYDAALRELVVARGEAAAPGLSRALDFFFGRPHPVTLVMYGLGVRRRDGAFILTRGHGVTMRRREKRACT